MVILYNLIWFILVGFATSIILFIIGILYSVTGVGSEYGQQIFRLSVFILAPYKKTPDTNFNSHKIANIIWLILFGWWLCALYIIAGLFLCCTLIGIPFGLQCFKNLAIICAPFGSTI